MRKIIVGAQVSLDGVMQAPGGRTEDPTKGFEFGGWAMPYFDDESNKEMGRLFEGELDLLLGRKTYEIFAAYWPYYSHDGEYGAIAKRFDEIKKYAVSWSAEVDTGWQNTVLLRDVAAIKRLKQESGPALLTQGSTQLVHALFANDLVDEIDAFIIPVVLGSGKKLFADGSTPHAFKLSRSHVCRNGVIAAHYVRSGDIKTIDMAQEKPSEREVARRARLEREG